MTRNEAKERYNQYFSTAEGKAIAFDKIAERYYFANFGTMSKSDLETMLFSIYLDQILDQHESEMESYSDYTLSKALGITQSKISSLKVKKELLYPYSGFDWRKSFARISENVNYENGKIMLHIPDRNLYLEVKHEIETSGGYVETQLSANLLQIRPEYFLDLMVAISEEKDRNRLRKEIREEFRKKNKDIVFLIVSQLGKPCDPKPLT